MDVIFTVTSNKLLTALLDDPLYEFKEIELIKKAKSGKGVSSNLLSELINEGVILERRVGKVKLVSLNLANPKTFLLKSLFDQRKLSELNKSKFASIIFFKESIKEFTNLFIVFGSTVAGTYTENSDIDILVVSDEFDKVEKERRKTQELFGEIFNLHHYGKEEVEKNITTDYFLRNALVTGCLFYGFDLGRELLSKFKEKTSLDRLFFLHERIKSALRNYLSNDKITSEEVIKTTLEQIIFYILADKKIQYASKKDASEAIMKLPEGNTLQKINKAHIKDKITLTESLILDLLKDAVLESEGYVNLGNKM